ncbi:hypothetical protein [Flavobacterium sp. YJ01]|uniref:hypothetical protein n=1 Tax=unclassified Flavobacterium TaxID=196869 RepID=UPI0023E3CFDE|nr:hypothetical protein [Flavobacterium sp. YJ01]WET02973.1 hypothetical protein P0R33_01320 [Flavobacterium sp. YJ01]
MRFFTPIKFGFLISVLAYILLNSIIAFKNYQNKKELSAFDLNQDGFFSNNEISAEQKEAMNKISNDTARNLAPLTLIPFTMILGYIAYKLKEKADQKVDFEN